MTSVRPTKRNDATSHAAKVESVNDDEDMYAVIRDAPDLSSESKDRYLRSLRNMVAAVHDVAAEDGAPVQRRPVGQKKSVSAMLERGRAAIDALRSRYASQRNGAVPSDATISSHCVAALALVKRLTPDRAAELGGREALHALWESCNADANRNIREKYENWEASEQQRRNFVPWERLIEKREHIGRHAYASPAHVLLCFLTMMPPMRTSDYSSLMLFDEAHPFPQRRSSQHARLHADANWVHLRRRSGVLVVNEYKTAQHYRRVYEPHGVTEANAHDPQRQRQHGQQDQRGSTGNGGAALTTTIPLTPLHSVDTEDAADTRESAVGAQQRSAQVSRIQPQQHGGARCVTVPHDIVVGPMYIPRGTYDDSAATRRGTIPPALFRVLRVAVSNRMKPSPGSPAQEPKRGRRSRATPFKPTQWVFLNASGQPYNGHSFGMMMNRTMKELFDGRAVTVNLVRHAASNWLDEYHRHNKTVLVYFRYWMMHSAGMQREYVLANNMESGGGA